MDIGQNKMPIRQGFLPNEYFKRSRMFLSSSPFGARDEDDGIQSRTCFYPRVDEVQFSSFRFVPLPSVFYNEFQGRQGVVPR